MTADAAVRSESNPQASDQDKTLLLDGLRFHYREWGSPDAPPLVLLHAYLMHARSWDTVAAGLSDRFRVLALDQRGHGDSEWATDYHEERLVEDLAAFVDALELSSCALAGFSIGGSTACSYAAFHPERVERLVMFECITEGNETGDVPYLRVMREHLHLLRTLPESFATPDEAVLAFRPLAPYATGDELRHWMLGGLKQDAGNRWVWRYDPVFRAPGEPGRLNPSSDKLLERLARVRCPILLPVGAESWMVEPTERAAEVNDRARYVEVPRAGHWIPLDNPSVFLEVVDGFLVEH